MGKGQDAFLSEAVASERPDELGEKRQQTQLRIIKGAASVFARHGLEATTVEHILKAAEVSRRTYYQFFADKTAALLAIYQRSTAHLIAVRRAAMQPPGSGLQRLLRGQQVYFDFLASSGPLIKILAAEALRPDSPLMQRRLWLHQSIEDLYRHTYHDSEGISLDPLAVRGLILFTESLSLHVLLHRGGEAALMAQAQDMLAQHLEQLIAQSREAGQ